MMRHCVTSCSCRTKDCNVTLDMLRAELGQNVSSVPWLEGFYTLPSDSNISSTKLYQSGLIYGMDVSSGAAIRALDVRPGDQCLDICCAPGAKLCMISDYLSGLGSVTGIDISEQRLAACRTMVNKYKCSNVRLMLGDGTTFLGPPPSLPYYAKRQWWKYGLPNPHSSRPGIDSNNTQAEAALEQTAAAAAEQASSTSVADASVKSQLTTPASNDNEDDNIDEPLSDDPDQTDKMVADSMAAVHRKRIANKKSNKRRRKAVEAAPGCTCATDIGATNAPDCTLLCQHQFFFQSKTFEDAFSHEQPQQSLYNKVCSL
jgi:hypothetical protein